VIDLFIAKLRARDEVSESEAAALRAAMTRIIEVPADVTVIEAGQDLTESWLLTSGYATRFKDMLNGNRQILELNIAGDFIDLHGFLLKVIDHSVGTLTPCTFALVAHDELKRITEEMPHLARLLWHQTVLDAAIHREWVTTLGQRPAIGRLAQLFLELDIRLGLVGLARDHSFLLPLTQTELAEVTGLTPVHVNRTLKAMREAGLVVARNGHVEILDLDGLKREAEFDPTYLNLLKHRR
jgi:CRP-like cAMP-binding protein